MRRNLAFAVLLGALSAFPAVAAEKKAEATGHDIVFLTDARPVRVRLHIEADGKPLEQVWQGFIKDVFTSLDEDKDGKLDKKEAARIPSPQSLFSSSPYFVGFGGKGVAEMKIDTDKDGSVTEKELGEFYAANGGPAFGIGGGNSGFGPRVVADYGGGNAGANSTTRLNKRLLELLDTDKDAKVSAKELAAAPAVLGKMDANEDEIVTAEELLGESSPNSGGGDVEVFALSTGAPQAQDYPFYAVPRQGSLDSVVTRLLTRYAAKGSDVSREKLGIDEKAFKAFDKDGNGKLDKKELELFLRGGADVELKVSLGQKNSAELASKEEALKAFAAEIKAEKSGGVTFKLGTNQFTLGFNGPGGVMGVAFDTKQIWKMQFTEADKDNNEYLDEKEATASPIFNGSFKRYDKDGDGKLYLKELLAIVDETAALTDKATKACVHLNVSDEGKGLFEMLDLSGDARLTVRELRQSKRLLEVLDTNKDEQVDRNEVPRTYALNARRGPVGGGSFGGAIAFATLARPGMVPQPAKKAEPVWFHKMDRNTDGDVSRKEFLGTDEQFKAIDTDGDGLISEAEAKAYAKGKNEK